MECLVLSMNVFLLMPPSPLPPIVLTIHTSLRLDLDVVDNKSDLTCKVFPRLVSDTSPTTVSCPWLRSPPVFELLVLLSLCTRTVLVA
jgi:hypothetical protein